MGLGNKGISIMQDAIIFCIITSMAALLLAPALLGGKMIHVYEEKESEERVNEALYTLLNCNTNFEYLLFDINSQGFATDLLKKFFGKEPLHVFYGELISTCLLCQINYGGKSYNIFIENFTKNIEEKIENFLEKYLKGYNFNLTVVWQPIMDFDFGGKISIGEKIPNESVYSANLFILMPPSLITSFGMELEKIKNEMSKEKIKEYLNSFVDEFVGEIFEESFNYFREEIFDFIQNDEFLGEDFNYLCNETISSIKNGINFFVEENYEIGKIFEKINFCTAKATLCIWR